MELTGINSEAKVQVWTGISKVCSGIGREGGGGPAGISFGGGTLPSPLTGGHPAAKAGVATGSKSSSYATDSPGGTVGIGGGPSGKSSGRSLYCFVGWKACQREPTDLERPSAWTF